MVAWSPVELSLEAPDPEGTVGALLALQYLVPVTNHSPPKIYGYQSHKLKTDLHANEVHRGLANTFPFPDTLPCKGI